MKKYFSKIALISYELSKVADNKLQSLPLGVLCAPKKDTLVASSRSYVHHNIKTLTKLAVYIISPKHHISKSSSTIIKTMENLYQS